MGIYNYYINNCYYQLFNNDKTNTIHKYENRCYRKMINIIITIKDKVLSLLENDYIYISKEMPEFYLLYINDIIYLEIINNYKNIDKNVLFMFIDIVIVILKTNYNSQIAIISDIMNFNNIVMEYKIFIVNKIILNSVNNAFDSVLFYYDPIIREDIKRNIAAMCIQKNWRYINTNPEYLIYKRRLQNEFKEMTNN